MKFKLIILLTLIFGSFTFLINAQDVDYLNPKSYELGPIRVEGADNFDHQAIKLIAGLRPGQTITVPGDAITTAIHNLYKEEIFSSIDIQVEKIINDILYLVIVVAPRPKLSKFKFVGVKKHDADKLREEITLYSGKTITENLVFATEAKIKGYYREKGFYSIKVNINRETDTIMNNSEVFVINIDKGEKVKIGDIEINGNETLSDRKLKRSMKDTKERAFYRVFKRSKFTESAYAKDKKAEIDKYNAIGLRDAIIEYDTVYLMDEKNLKITQEIAEGKKYYFGDIEWIGNTKFTSTFLDTVLGIKKGDVYNKALLETRVYMSQDGRDISSLYMDRGYLFFQIIPIETSINDTLINYQMRIIEGKEARVRKIIIKGNTKTNEQVIRREIRTKPGDLFNRNDIIRTQRELAQLGYFNEQAFQVNPIPNPQDGTVDIEYIVEEKSSDQIELSGGYSGRNQLTQSAGIIGTLGLTFNNFSTKNVFKKGSWTPLPSGDGQRLSIRAQATGRNYQSYNFSFTEPWLGGKRPNSLTYYFSHTQIGNGYAPKNTLYNGLQITGMGLGLGRRKKFPDDYFSAYYEVAYQYYDINNYAIIPGFSEGYANDISLKYVLSRSSVSSPIYPQEGSTITFTGTSTLPYSLLDDRDDYSGLTQQERFKYLEYYKLKLTGTWYLPLTRDKKLVLATKVGFGFLGVFTQEKGISPFGRFSLGGSGLSGVGQVGGREIIALRGYNDNSISSTGGDPLITKYSLEMRYPISLNPQATFYVLGFAEAGNTFPTIKEFNPFNVMRSAGVGIRVFLPMFGMLGIDYGWGYDYMNSWSGNRISDASIKEKGYFPKLTFTIGANLGDL